MKRSSNLNTVKEAAAGYNPLYCIVLKSTRSSASTGKIGNGISIYCESFKARFRFGTSRKNGTRGKCLNAKNGCIEGLEFIPMREKLYKHKNNGVSKNRVK